MRQMIVIFGVLAFALVLSGQGQGKGKAKGKPSDSRDTANVAVSVVFGRSDQRIIRDWVRATPSSQLPPGLAKRGDLPPGLQKQLQRKGTLPPGLQKRISPFPRELTGRLGPLPAGCGCDRIFLDGKALVVARATNAILDVMNLF
jgi:hypothetical protein